MIHLVFILTAIPYAVLFAHYAVKAVAKRNPRSRSRMGRLLRWPSAFLAFLCAWPPFTLAWGLGYVSRDFVAGPMLALALPAGVLGLYIVLHAEAQR